jgi:hypothetical protein
MKVKTQIFMPLSFYRLPSTISFIFMAADKARSRRFGEPAKFLPVVFVIGVISTLYGIYTYVCSILLVKSLFPDAFISPAPGSHT